MIKNDPEAVILFFDIYYIHLLICYYEIQPARNLKNTGIGGNYGLIILSGGKMIFLAIVMVSFGKMMISFRSTKH